MAPSSMLRCVASVARALTWPGVDVPCAAALALALALPLARKAEGCNAMLISIVVHMYLATVTVTDWYVHLYFIPCWLADDDMAVRERAPGRGAWAWVYAGHMLGYISVGVAGDLDFCCLREKVGRYDMRDMHPVRACDCICWSGFLCCPWLSLYAVSQYIYARACLLATHAVST